MLRPTILLGLALLMPSAWASSPSSVSGTSGVPEIPTNGQIGELEYPPFPKGVQADDIVYESFTAKVTTEQGQNVAQLYSTFRFNRWPEGVKTMFCAIRNYNGTDQGGGSNFAIKNRREYFPEKKYGTNYQVALSEFGGRIVWDFQRPGEYLQEGHTWTLYAKVVMNDNANIAKTTWSAYCETKQDGLFGPPPGNANLSSWYYFRSWMELPIPQLTSIKPAMGPVGPRPSDAQKALKQQARKNKRTKARREKAARDKGNKNKKE